VGTIQTIDDLESDALRVDANVALAVYTPDILFDRILFETSGSFDSGLRTLEPAIYCVSTDISLSAETLSDVAVEYAPMATISYDFVVPEPAALAQGLAAIAVLLLCSFVRPARALVAIDPVSSACHRSDPEASPFDLSLRARLYEVDACPGPGQCEDEIDERSQNEVPGSGGFDDALGRDMDVDGPASGEARVATSAAWSYAEQVFGEETGQSLAAGTLEMSLLVEFVVPEGLRAGGALASARGCYCFEVTEFPALRSVRDRDQRARRRL
jgi:hypothetical protein